MHKKHNAFTRQRAKTYHYIIGGFLLLILFGAILLSMPFSSTANESTPFIDSLFTSVSATCVTGLVVKDTATHWSLFGQILILIMIQIGGMGVITLALGLIITSGRKIGLWERSTMQEIIAAPRMGGIIRLTGHTIKMIVIFELCGALLLLPRFIDDFGVLNGIWYSLFHAVSAFCNAGFDLMGIRGQFSSLTSYYADIYVNVIIMALITIGGIGFITWDDIRRNKLRFKRYTLQSKIIIITSLVLVILPAAYFFVFDFKNLPAGQRLTVSLFQSVTCRTAGFNTADLRHMDDSGNFIMIILMLIGGSPGSTAGGLKTTTIATLFLAAIAVFSRRSSVRVLDRSLTNETVRNAGAILFLYMTFFIGGAIIISKVDDLPLLDCLFETASAIGTVGLTLGITSTLSAVSKIILMILMFLGRVGVLTLIYATVPAADDQLLKYPNEKIAIG
ncbi:MAG: Trk family potassium uptake protein [Erysipelotrichaceae bacterium]|nr:Trk family potassium uptake protein [Erysipelotrichaceae bacterium]